MLIVHWDQEEVINLILPYQNWTHNKYLIDAVDREEMTNEIKVSALQCLCIHHPLLEQLTYKLK